MDTTPQNMVHHKYGRDYLLQLRLHPFSLQKPDNLKNHDIVKEKLYLHQLNFGSGSRNNQLSCYPNLQLPLKDPENVLRYHQPVTDCFTRNYSSYVAGRKSNSGMHVKPSIKSRQLYIPDYVNSMQKLQLQNASDYEGFLNDGSLYCSNASWLKQCCSLSEETWNCRNRQCDHESSSKTSFEGSTKSKKKPIPIIDPKNGKNILDGICEVSTTSQETLISEGNDGNSEMKSGDALITELNKQSDHDECSLSETNYNNETDNITQNLPDIDGSCVSQISDFGNQNLSCKDKEPKRICEDHGNNIPATIKVENHTLKYDLDIDVKKATEKAVDNHTAMKEMLDSDYEFYRKLTSSSYDGPRISDSFESLEGNTSKDVHDDCPDEEKHTSDRYKTMAVQENGFTFEEQLKMNIKLLREKIYSIRQEQQKMAIMQSYLCFKKHQLDGKKIETANWECNLVNQAKRLQERECRLEAKRLSLLDKESKLDEREKMLNDIQKYTETKFQQGDTTSEKIEVNLESKANDSEKAFSINYELGDTSEVKF